MREVANLCLQNPNNETSLKNMFLTRQKIKKSEIKLALQKLRDSNKDDLYAKSLKKYTELEQVRKGDLFYDFSAITSENKDFILSSYSENKNTLLIFGGLGCMKKTTLNYLIEINKHLETDKFQIVSFSFTSNYQELLREKEKYKIPWIIVSDFEGDLSDTKLVYDIYGTPSVVLIDSDGKILVNQLGMSNKIFRFLEKHT